MSTNRRRPLPAGRTGSSNSGRWSRITPFHCVTWTGCTRYSRAICPTVLTPIKASKPTLALKAPVYRFRLALLIVLPFSHAQQNPKSLT